MNPATSAAKDSSRPVLVLELETARSVLAFLTGGQEIQDIDRYDPDQLAAWLTGSELASLAHVAFRENLPELSERLQPQYFATAAQNALHWRNLQQIDSQLDRLAIPSVVLKGAALAATVYQGPELRSMADVDLWFRRQDMGPACQLMADHGFTNRQKATRPLALQLLSEGEVQYLSADQPPTLVELHLSPFKGWWLQRTATIDKDEVWSRKEPLDGWGSFYQLAAEDALIHTAIHLVVNHQFSLAPLRSLVDLAMIARGRVIDWNVVAQRASEWRVATAVWLALHILQQTIGTPGLESVLEQLQPSPWRRGRLQRFVSPESILAGTEISDGRSRYLFLLLLVDRPQDAAKIMGRTLWPESEWLDARYGGGVNHWQHILRLISQRDI